MQAISGQAWLHNVVNIGSDLANDGSKFSYIVLEQLSGWSKLII